MDLQLEVKPLQIQISDLVQAATTLTVDNDVSNEAAFAIRKELKAALDKVTARESEFTRPANELLKKVRDVFRPIKDELNAALLHIQSQTSTYHIEQKRIEAELQAKEDRKAERNFNRNKNNPLPVPVPVHVEIIQKVDGVAMIDRWVAEIVDINSVPAVWNGIQILAPVVGELTKIGTSSKGTATIPGVQWKYAPYPRGTR